jgi:hypothetical protein
MDPKFVEDHLNQLGEKLTLIDRHNRKISVQFNYSLQHPLIYKNWIEMTELFGIQGNKLLQLSIFFIN